MSREILFKAKAINRNDDNGCYRTSYKNGDWVYGLVTKLFDDRFENCPAAMKNTDGVSGVEVDHNTICQYTGLTDNNGNKIFENDIVKHDFGENQIGEQFAIVKYNSKYASYFIEPIDDWMYCDKSNCLVIGNVFDNPELIGK